MTTLAKVPDVRERGLLRTVCEYPDDDTPRLVYADWLEEQAGTVPCKRCDSSSGVIWASDPHDGEKYPVLKEWECPRCRGAGRISDGRAERAKFIRVQCELEPVRSHGHGTEKPHRGACVICSLVAHLERRERELIHAHVEWADDVWPVPNHHWYPIEVGFLSADAGAELQFRRGFVEEVTCTTQDWKDHGPTIVACQPVREAALSDKQPQEYGRRLYGWYRGLGPDTINDHSLSPDLWDLISTRPGCIVNRPWADFSTKIEALAAASVACVCWARDKAGLPGLLEGW
jgi:uncharacterized protein (TIGR02996 family)